MTHRWPPLSALAWNICILFSANDAYMRELARTVSNTREDGNAPDQMDNASGTTASSTGLGLKAPDAGGTLR